VPGFEKPAGDAPRLFVLLRNCWRYIFTFRSLTGLPLRSVSETSLPITVCIGDVAEVEWLSPGRVARRSCRLRGEMSANDPKRAVKQFAKTLAGNNKTKSVRSCFKAAIKITKTICGCFDTSGAVGKPQRRLRSFLTATVRTNR
jgi:hypothetical protein